MAVNWPASLPQQPATYSEKAKPVTMRTQPDSGPTKSRRRFTKMGRVGKMTFLLTIAERNTLDTFFETSCNCGTIAMNFVHPWTGLTKQMFITDTPDYGSDGPLGVSAALSVEFF